MRLYFGGEPLLMFDKIKELTSYAHQQGQKNNKRMYFRISTNGLLFNEERLDFCRRHQIFFAISLDGDREAHNAMRIFPDGTGSFDALDAKLDMILKYNPYTVITSVITPQTVERLYSSIKYIWGRGIRYFVHALDYTHPDWTPEHLERLAQSYKQLGEFYMEKIRSQEHFHFGLFDDKLKTHISSPIKLGEICDFGVKKISVAPDGRVFPCVQFVSDREDAGDYCIGHVESGLTERRKELILENKTERKQCEGCAFLGRCSNYNYCGCLNWQVSGKIGEVPGILCSHEQMLIPIVDQVGNQLWTEQNTGFMNKHYKNFKDLFPYSID
jgi:uncharacterized protein